MYLLLDVDVTRSVITEEVHMRYTVPGSYQMNAYTVVRGYCTCSELGLMP